MHTYIHTSNGLRILYKACLPAVSLIYPSSFNIFSGDLYFDALIIGLFQICLVMSQALGEGTF